MRSKLSTNRLFFILVTAAAFLGLAGCSALVALGLMDQPDVPAVDQITPTAETGGLIAGRVWQDQCLQPDDCQIAPDSSIRPNGIEDPGEPGLIDVTVELGLGACPSTGLAETVSGANGTFVFSGLETGTYCLSIDPNRTGNADILGRSPWTHPAYASGVSRITITMRQPGETRLANFGRQLAQISETPTAAPTSAPDVPTATPAATGCLDWASFVTDVTIADGTRIGANKSFDKTWRFRNAGTCTWTTGYDLVFVSGNRLDGPSARNLPRSVAPGESIDLTVRLKAPASTGLYHGYWMLRNEDDELFGLGTKANQPFWVQIVVGSLGTTTSGSWRGEYFASRDLKGTAGFVRNDPVIDFNWNDGSPGTPLAANNFSVRWTGQSQFEAGTYRFKVKVDDGARLWVDDKVVIDSWRDGSTRDLSADVALARGTHKIRLDYYERSGDAQVRLSWSEVDDPAFAQWKGQYWTNSEFKGSPALVRNDGEINFDWDDGSPAVGIPNNDFSVRWTRDVTFEQGTYRFNLQADDGVRLWIGDNRVINEWHASSGSQVYSTEVTLTGKQRLKVEYYEGSGDARVRLWWERVQPTATPTATATNTGDPSPTETDVPPATETPMPTATDETPATNTPVPTETTAPSVVLDLASSACSAEWDNESGNVACPGSTGDASGAVYELNNANTEAGSLAGLSLIMEPEQTALGYLRGRYPAVSLEAGDRLVARIGCLADRPSCAIEFEVQLKVGDQTITLGSWSESSDGTLRSIDLDLSAYAGQSVTPILLVRADTSSSHNAAVWVTPRILR